MDSCCHYADDGGGAAVKERKREDAVEVDDQGHGAQHAAAAHLALRCIAVCLIVQWCLLNFVLLQMAAEPESVERI